MKTPIGFNKCTFGMLSGVLFITFWIYRLTNDFLVTAQRGVIQFRYHSNLFYGEEAIIMYVCFYTLIGILGFSIGWWVFKCYSGR